MAISAQRLGTVVDPPAGATTVLYTVPAGRRSILRDVRAEFFVAAGTVTLIRINPAASAASVEIIRLLPSATRHVVALQDAFIVLDEGDAIEANVGTGNDGEVWLSGHEFVLP